MTLSAAVGKSPHNSLLSTACVYVDISHTSLATMVVIKCMLIFAIHGVVIVCKHVMLTFPTCLTIHDVVMVCVYVDISHMFHAFNVQQTVNKEPAVNECFSNRIVE